MITRDTPYPIVSPPDLAHPKVATPGALFRVLRGRILIASFHVPGLGGRRCPALAPLWPWGVPGRESAQRTNHDN